MLPIFAGRAEAARPSAAVTSLLAEEAARGDREEFYRDFGARVECLRDSLVVRTVESAPL
jgi:hypothetical protein